MRGRPPLPGRDRGGEDLIDGMTVDEILDEHPDLEAEDIAESLRYAALSVQERKLPLRQSA